MIIVNEPEKNLYVIQGNDSDIENFYKAIESNSVNENNINHFNNVSLTQKEIQEITIALNEKIKEIIDNRYDHSGESQRRYDVSMLVLPKQY